MEKNVVYGLMKIRKKRELAEASHGYIAGDVSDIKNQYIRLGFHLNECYKKKYYEDFGYENFNEYCEKNFRLDKTAVSRCISVWESFAEVERDSRKMWIDKKYENFNYSQLCELLPLTEKQRKQVRPEMSVKQIRELKKKWKDTSRSERDAVATSQPEESGKVNEKNGYDSEETDVMLQSEESGKVNESCDRNVEEPIVEEQPQVEHFKYDGESYGYYWAGIVKAYLKAGYKELASECKVNYLGGLHRVRKKEKVTEFCDIFGDLAFDVENIRLEEEYKRMEEIKPELLVSKTEEAEAGQMAEEPEPEVGQAAKEPEEAEFQNECGSEAEAVEQTQQPEFPDMKNMQEREEFVKRYKEWNVWCRNENTEDIYYKYDLPDGAAIVVRNYPVYIEWTKEEIERAEYFLLKKGYRHFMDCKSCMTELKEYLRKMEKQGN